MKTSLTYYGHSSFSININGTNVLLDPYISDNPMTTIDPSTVDADYILVSHGHQDHLGDTIPIAKRTKATVIANFEIANWLTSQGLKNLHPQHIGGGYNHSFGYTKMTQALHGSSLPDGSYGGNPCGFVISDAIEKDKSIYFACDTGLFSDMKLIGQENIYVAVVPIGDNFTMGPNDAIKAIELIRPQIAIPVHYNTWPLINQDPLSWKNKIEERTDTKVIILEADQKITF